LRALALLEHPASVSSQGSKGVRVSMTKSMSPWNLEGEVTTGCVNLLIDYGRFTIKSNRIVTKEGSKGYHESVASMTLPEKEQALCEKELNECVRFAKLSNISMRPRLTHQVVKKLSKTARARQSLSWNIFKR